MCQYEKCVGTYGEAYQGCESVHLDVALLCPKCATRIDASNHIHFGGEQWEPFMKCPSCEWSVFLYVKPKTMFLSRKGPMTSIPEPATKQSEAQEKTVDEMTAEYNERRIWWQEEVDRQAAALAGWGPLEYWRGIFIGDLAPERKRAVAASIEHAIEEAKSA